MSRNAVLRMIDRWFESFLVFFLRNLSEQQVTHHLVAIETVSNSLEHHRRVISHLQPEDQKRLNEVFEKFVNDVIESTEGIPTCLRYCSPEFKAQTSQRLKTVLGKLKPA